MGKIGPQPELEMTLTGAVEPLREMPVAELLNAAERAKGGEAALYRAWLEANADSAQGWVAWFNLGVVLAREGDTEGAGRAYEAALAQNPGLHAASVNLGLLFENAGQPEQALNVWRQATQPDEARVALQIQQGRLLETLGRLSEAEHLFDQVLKLDPEQHDVLHHWLHLRQKACQWPVFSNPAQIVGSGPLGILALTDDIGVQREVAGAWVKRKTAPAPRALAPKRGYAHKRLRIGYMSSDFCRHAMSYLITELIESHNRARVEVYAYCSTREDGSALRQRMLGAFDHVRLIRELSDEAAAEVIRADEIDVLIDLNGITDGSRLAVLRWRPAPVQGTYLGFVGPIPLPELDYILADHVVIPPEYEAEYGTKLLAVGPMYQANDSKRSLGRALTRAAEGLPEGRFVLCCFSKHYKVTQEMFAAWMEILRRAPNAVLWLAEDNEVSQRNLSAAAARDGVAPQRLIFSPRTDPDTYMSRLALADLFLDTFPYNAGTVASDALRMGLPLVTLCGRGFASRMATSLLHALGASDGMTTSISGYVETAVRLATEPSAYVRYRARFSARAWRETLGNTARFTAGYEDALEGAVRALRPAVTGTAEVLAQGEALLAQGERAQALSALRRALILQPDFVEAYVSLGAALLDMRRFDEAIAVLRDAAALEPGSVLAQTNLATALLFKGQNAESREACHAAVALDPQEAPILATLGGLLLELGETGIAVELCRRAVAQGPGLASAWFNLSHGCKALNLVPEAVAAVRHALALVPEEATYHFHLAHLLLLRGDLRAGWEEYEWRWKLPEFRYPDFAQPQWAGEELAGKTILVGVEQGLGDIIQFARYLPLLAARAGRVKVLATPPVRRLLGGIEGVEVVDSAEGQDFDVHCPLLSLPRGFGTTAQNIPQNVPYLRAPARVLEGDGLKVGIVWAGNPATKRDHMRSPGLATVLPLFEVPGVSFHVLQMGPGRDDLAAHPLPEGVRDWGAGISDLADTAALMSGMDLVISSCTAPLHLAGALGVPAWAMLPFAPHFTWFLEGATTPWYPTLRLYRQEEPGRNWSGAVSRMAADLAALVCGRS